MSSKFTIKFTPDDLKYPDDLVKLIPINNYDLYSLGSGDQFPNIIRSYWELQGNYNQPSDDQLKAWILRNRTDPLIVQANLIKLITNSGYNPVVIFRDWITNNGDWGGEIMSLEDLPLESKSIDNFNQQESLFSIWYHRSSFKISL